LETDTYFPHSQAYFSFGTFFVFTVSNLKLNVMKKLVLISVALFGLTISSSSAQALRKVSNTAFKRGEYTLYRVYYDAVLTGKVNAGEAELSIKDENKLIGNRPTFHVVGLGLTKGAFNLFYKVVDRYETYIDEDAIVPWLFIRRVNEGGYKINQDVTFNQNKDIAISQDYKKNKQTTTKVTNDIQDIISAIYYARTLDYSSMKVGASANINFFLDDSIYISKVQYLGKQQLTIGAGTFNCLKFKPMVATGNVFKDPYPMTLWVTDDKNHLPVFAESEIIVGKVKMELVKYSGLANPLTSKVK